jgi:hypothetical protein
MVIKKYRWSKDYESAEEELLRFFTVRGIDPIRWELAPAESYVPEPERAPNKRTIWCAEGSLIVTIDTKDISLQPGDTLELADIANCVITAGIAGCVCYESRQPSP